MMTKQTFNLEELCTMTDLTKRTVRYYVQLGLVDKPVGETRAAVYGAVQLEQLLLIKKWSSAGISLERIRLLLQGEPPPVADQPKKPGTVEVRSHLFVDDGVELAVDAARSNLSPEKLRRFFKAVIDSYQEITTENNNPEGQDNAQRN